MIHLIAAVDRNGGIGKDNDLLCHISADLKRFKSLTMGHTMLMGRKTFESLPGVLPGRPHWVLTHQKDYSVSHDAVTIFHSVEAMQQAMDALTIQPEIALIDGNRDKGRSAAITTPHKLVVGGDGKSASIAAASILAKGPVRGR